MSGTLIVLAPSAHGHAMRGGAEVAANQAVRLCLAQGEAMRELAHGLVASQYAARGYGVPPRIRPRPGVASFLVFRDAPAGGKCRLPAAQGSEPFGETCFIDPDVIEPVATLSMRLDTSDGLACDGLYRSEADALRDEGSRLCEFVRLAAAPGFPLPGLLPALFHAAFAFVHHLGGASDVLVEVNPQHRRFYRNSLGLTQIGPLRRHPHVNAPAVLLHGSCAHIAAEIARHGGRAGSAPRAASYYQQFLSPQQELHLVAALRAALADEHDPTHSTPLAAQPAP